MKIVFSLAHVGFVRNYDRTLRHLAAHGHQIHIAVLTARNKLREKSTLDRLMVDCPNVTYGQWPKTKSSVWTSAALAIRVTQDYIRYLDPRYRSSTELRKRVVSKTPVGGVWFATIFAGVGSWPRRVCLWLLSWLDRAMPLNVEALAFLREHKPDVFLVTPLIDVASTQVEHVKVAKALGIPAALCVASWDNLTNKGLIREIPHRIFVWNESQRQEAVELHGVKREQVVVSGAQIFDHWFDATETESREVFCNKVGLNPQRPFILYIGSSRFIAPDEALFMLDFIEELQHAADPDMRDVGVLVRPHPTNIRHWRAFERPTAKTDVRKPTTTVSVSRPRETWRVRNRQPLRFENLAFWPPLESVPDDGKDSLWDFFSVENKLDYFHSIYHSGVVIGVNSSGMVEAGIVGRSVCSPVVPEFSHSQGGTLHFDHLLKVGGGLLYTAKTTEEFLQVIRERLRAGEHPDPKSQRFTEAFLRPRGIGQEVSPILAQEIEALAELSVVPQRFFPALYPARAVAYVIGRLAGAEPTKTRKPPHLLRKGKRKTWHQRAAPWVMRVIRPLAFVVIHIAIPLVQLWETVVPRVRSVQRSVRVLRRTSLRMGKVIRTRVREARHHTRKRLLKTAITRPARAGRRALSKVAGAVRNYEKPMKRWWRRTFKTVLHKLRRVRGAVSRSNRLLSHRVLKLRRMPSSFLRRRLHRSRKLGQREGHFALNGLRRVRNYLG